MTHKLIKSLDNDSTNTIITTKNALNQLRVLYIGFYILLLSYYFKNSSVDVSMIIDNNL
jgi:hypothetical protein